MARNPSGNDVTLAVLRAIQGNMGRGAAPPQEIERAIRQEVTAGLPHITASRLPTRTLGRTGLEATIFGLGGEGILRTTGEERAARVVIEAALAAGVNYFDTAPAYDGSIDYLGAAFREHHLPRDSIILASKTHDRTYDGSMHLLEDTLRRLGTDRLDIWQVHDLRTIADVNAVFDRRGAIHAIDEARRDGRVRYAGLTGHYDPAVLLDAMRRYRFDTVLMPVNPADKARLSFINIIIPEARRQGMGIIGMKVTAQGALVQAGFAMRDLLDYALSQDIDCAIVGCTSKRDVDEDAAYASAFSPMRLSRKYLLETTAASLIPPVNHFKRP